MAKSSISDILEVQRLISKLDKRGKRAILRDLQKQNLLQPDLTITSTEQMHERYGTKKEPGLTKEPVKEKEGGEQ